MLLAGGQGGVYRAIDPAGPSPVWTEFGAGLPEAPVNDVIYDPTDDLLLAGIYGRGAWTIGNASNKLATPNVLQIDGTGLDDTIRLIRDAVNPNFLDIFINNNTSTPDQMVEMSTIDEIDVNGLGGNDTLIIDQSNGVIAPPSGIHYDGGAGTADKLVLRGGSFTNEIDTATGPGSGTIKLDGNVIEYKDLAPIDDTVSVLNFTLDAPATDDDIRIVNGPVVSGSQTATIRSNNGTFELVNFANKTNVTVNGQNGADTFTLNLTVAPDGLSTVSLNGEDSINSGDDNAADVFNINATTGIITTTAAAVAGRIRSTSSARGSRRQPTSC